MQSPMASTSLYSHVAKQWISRHHCILTGLGCQSISLFTPSKKKKLIDAVNISLYLFFSRNNSFKKCAVRGHTIPQVEAIRFLTRLSYFYTVALYSSIYLRLNVTFKKYNFKPLTHREMRAGWPVVGSSLLFQRSEMERDRRREDGPLLSGSCRKPNLRVDRYAPIVVDYGHFRPVKYIYYHGLKTRQVTTLVLCCSG